MYCSSHNLIELKLIIMLDLHPSQHAVIGADISGWQAAVLGRRLPITARFPAADAALALAGGDLSVLGPRKARALISDARRIPMIYYLY